MCDGIEQPAATVAGDAAALPPSKACRDSTTSTLTTATTATAMREVTFAAADCIKERDSEADSASMEVNQRRMSIDSIDSMTTSRVEPRESRRTSVQSRASCQSGPSRRVRSSRRGSMTETDYAAIQAKKSVMDSTTSIMENFAMHVMMNGLGDEEDDEDEEVASVPTSRLLRLMMSEWKLLIPGCIAMFLHMAADAVAPIFIGFAADVAIGERGDEREARLTQAMGLLFALRGFGIVLKFFQFFALGIGAERIICRIRRSLFEALMKQDIAFFGCHECADLVSRLGADVQEMHGGVSGAWTEILSCVVRLGLYLALMFLTTWTLASMVVGMAVCLLLLMLPWLGAIASVSGNFLEALGSCATLAQESLAAIRLVRSSGGEIFEMSRYGAVVGNPDRAGLCSWLPPKSDTSLYRAAIVKHVVLTSCVMLMMGASALMLTGILWYGFLQVIWGEITMGQLTSFLMFMVNIGFALAGFGISFSQVFAAKGAAGRIYAIIDRTPTISTQQGGASFDDFAGEIRFDDVWFSYPSNPGTAILQGLSITVPPNRSTALVGGSGSGKSTALALIARFFDADVGSVTFDGRDLREVSMAWLRSKVSFVHQEPVLFSMSIRENIAYGYTAHSMMKGLPQMVGDDAVEQAAANANAHDFIVKLPRGYSTICGAKGSWLSGGQKQRVSIARALISNPKVLLLDEATSALDAESEHLVQQAIVRMRHGRTVIAVAHRLSTVWDSDQIIVLDEGQVRSSGRHSELMRNCQRYRDLVQRQTGDAPDSDERGAVDDVVADSAAVGEEGPVQTPPGPLLVMHEEELALERPTLLSDAVEGELAKEQEL